MKNYNKGFSLVEMVLTLAIFSVIMVAIIAMMDSTSVSYKKGLATIETQEEAQIVSNQLNDLLCDAKKVYGDYDSSTAGSSLHFQDIDGVETYIRLDNSKLYIKQGAGSEQLFAEHVSSLKVTGVEDIEDEKAAALAAGTPFDAATFVMDNCATISIELENKDNYYESNKVVYFRNSIENPYFGQITQASTGGNSEESEYADTVVILRYEPLDLSAEYDLISDVSINSSANSYYELDEYTNPMNVSKKQYVLKLKDTYNADLTADVPKTLKCEVKGKNASGEELKLLVYTEPVSFDVGQGVLTYHKSITTNKGYHTNILVKGININKALKSGVTVKYEVDASFGQNAGPQVKDQSLSYTTNAVSTVGNQINYNGGRIAIGLSADPNGNGVVISTCNDALYDEEADGGKLKGIDNKQIKFFVYVNGKKYECPYKFVLASETL